MSHLNNENLAMSLLRLSNLGSYGLHLHREAPCPAVSQLPVENNDASCPQILSGAAAGIVLAQGGGQKSYCVALGKSLRLSGPLFPSAQGWDGRDDSFSPRLLLARGQGCIRE